MEKPTILQIPRRFTKQEWGGTESVILHTSQELARRGYEVRILTSDLLSAPGEEVVDGLKVCRFHGFYPRRGLSAEAKKQLNIRGGNYFCPGLFRALLTAKNLKAVHLHTGGLIGAMGRLAAKLRGVPYVISIHGGQADLPKEQMDQLLAPLQGTFNWGKILEIILRTNRVHADADAIISLGESERRKLREQYPHTRVEVLPNGVDYRRFASADGAAFRKKYRLGNGPLILCVGSFHRQKNQMTLFEAFAGLRKTSMSDVKLVLIGVVYDEAYFREISARAADSGLADSTLLLPNLPYDSPDLANAYAAADLFVLPSLYEPFGIVVLEAWSAKCPVICARTGGLADFGHDGDNLRFTDTSDAGALAEAIAELHFTPSLSARLAANGQKTAEACSWEAITEKLLNFYRKP